jgi:hypothetical protein
VVGGKDRRRKHRLQHPRRGEELSRFCRSPTQGPPSSGPFSLAEPARGPSQPRRASWVSSRTMGATSYPPPRALNARRYRLRSLSRTPQHAASSGERLRWPGHSAQERGAINADERSCSPWSLRRRRAPALLCSFGNSNARPLPPPGSADRADEVTEGGGAMSAFAQVFGRRQMSPPIVAVISARFSGRHLSRR